MTFLYEQEQFSLTWHLDELVGFNAFKTYVQPKNRMSLPHSLLCISVRIDIKCKKPSPSVSVSKK